MRKLDLSPISNADFDGELVMENGRPSELDPVDWISNRILGLDSVDGMTFKEIEERLSIIDKVRAGKAAGEVLLEDAEWDKIRGALDKFKLAVVNRAYVAFGRRIHDAPEVEAVEAVEAPAG